MPEEDSSLGARLRESEARYRSVVEAMTEGVVLQSRDGTILACNSSATRILGLTEGQMKGRTSHDPRWRSVRADGSAYPGEEHPAMVTLRTGTPIREAVMGVHKADGTLTWIEINTEPLFEHGDPTPHAVVASFSDRKSVV